MAISSIGHQPELTVDEAMRTFEKRFQDRYQVYKAKTFQRDFVVKKSGWTGAGVRLKQEPDKTSFVYTAMMPNPILRGLFTGLVPYLFLRGDWRKMEAEVAACVRQEFMPKTESAQAKAA